MSDEMYEEQLASLREDFKEVLEERDAAMDQMAKQAELLERSAGLIRLGMAVVDELEKERDDAYRLIERAWDIAEVEEVTDSFARKWIARELKDEAERIREMDLDDE